jgi:hypothetical protein
MLIFKSKTEIIYKFVYEFRSGFRDSRKTLLLTARDPVQAVKVFNRMTDNELVNIIEFTEVKPKVEED